ncbi:MAG: O-antigen ligase family protein [Acidobacteriota bacterium]
MSRVVTVEGEATAPDERAAGRSRLASILGTTVFVSLLALIVLTAIPYGTSQPWWKAAFVCAVFILAMFWLIEGFVSQSWFVDSLPLVVPLAALTLFSFLQTLARGNSSSNPGGIGFPQWNAISADPYQTRFFALQLLALTVTAVLLFRYLSSEKRLRLLINLVILVVVASAIFGILRQTTQANVGSLLPLAPDLGYGQFINRNHFAFLMEMGFGLILGLILGGGVKREHGLIYFAALLPIWIGLVLCNSRGGLIAMLAQVVVAVLFFTFMVPRGRTGRSQSKILGLTQSLPVRVVLILVLIGGVLFGTVWLGGDRLAERIEDRTELSADIAGLRYGARRNEIWQATWRTFVAHPVLGVGLGGYWAVIPTYHDASGTMTPQEAHNDYLELLASGGLVGLALMVWFAVVVLKRTRENMRARNPFRRAACFGAAIGIAGVAVHSLVDFGLHTLVNALVFTTLVVIATSKAHWGNETAKS